MVAFFVPIPIFLPSATLTQKGYGHVYGPSNTGNLVQSYANVDGGSAPAAGDLVIWLAFAHDSGGSPVNDLTGAGWVQQSAYNNSAAATLLAKVATSGDISSPPTMVTAPVFGSISFWVAYSVSGSISSLTIPTFNWEFAGSPAPSNQVVNSSALNPPAVAISIAGGGGDDDNPNLQISGASADIDWSSTDGRWVNGNVEDRYMVNLSIGGANITFSKSDDGGSNHMASGYVEVS